MGGCGECAWGHQYPNTSKRRGDGWLTLALGTDASAAAVDPAANVNSEDETELTTYISGLNNEQLTLAVMLTMERMVFSRSSFDAG